MENIEEMHEVAIKENEEWNLHAITGTVFEKPKEPGLFPELQSTIDKEWQGMPEFTHKNTRPFQKIVVNFKTREDVLAFAEKIGQQLTNDTDTIWFPKKQYPTTQSYQDEP